MKSKFSAALLLFVLFTYSACGDNDDDNNNDTPAPIQPQGTQPATATPGGPSPEATILGGESATPVPPPAGSPVPIGAPTALPTLAPPVAPTAPANGTPSVSGTISPSPTVLPTLPHGHGGTVPAPVGPTSTLTYADVKAIIDATCVRCHNANRPNLPDFSTGERVLGMRTQMLTAVSQGIMPPGQPEWKDTDDGKKLIEWLANGVEFRP